jgi:hypothetical protein
MMLCAQSEAGESFTARAFFINGEGGRLQALLSFHVSVKSCWMLIAKSAGYRSARAGRQRRQRLSAFRRFI